MLALLVSGAHQIAYSRNPAHSTVDAAVDAARILKQERAAGLVNAVLRRFSREKDALFAKADQDIATRTAHPNWLVERFKAAWPDHYAALLDANNEHPPMVVRVDITRTTVEEYIAELAAVEIASRALPWAPAAVRLEQPVAVSALPGFAEGRVSVQDSRGTARRASTRLRARHARAGCLRGAGRQNGQLAGDHAIIGVDRRRYRRSAHHPRAGEPRQAGRKATLVVADIGEPDSFWDQRPFDRILLDAPCSSTGVIRRHPDIKLLRRPADIAALAATQLRLLKMCFRMLAPGGRLIYSTCSVVPEESEGVLASFLRKERRARVLPVPLAAEVPGALVREVGVQLLPGIEAATDGFHYACVEKTTDGT